MNSNPKLKDFVKRGTNIHPKHKDDLFYLLIPLSIVSLIVALSGLVGIAKLIQYIIK